VYGLIGHAASIGGSIAALLALVVSTFRGVSGWALALRAATAFVVVSVLLNLLGYFMARSVLAGIVARDIERKETAGSKRSR
jgi:hypothetical protein